MTDFLSEEPIHDPVAFPTLTPDQIAVLAPYGERIAVAAGEGVWEPGEAGMVLFVIVSGEMKVTDGRSGTFLTTHRAGGFTGDVDVISGRPSLLRAVATTDLEMIRISGESVRQIVGERSELGDVLLRAMLRRRALQQATSAVGVLVLGSRFDAATLRIREFLARNRYPVAWEDLEGEGEARVLLAGFGVPESETPVVVLPHGEVLRHPSNAQIGAALGVHVQTEATTFDVVIVGAGPAGLAAAVYGASEGLNTLVLDADGPGGQAGSSSRIENYMGFPTGISGQDLADGATIQAERFGARFASPARVIGLACAEVGAHELQVEGMGMVTARCVVLATGARYQTLGVERLSEFEGRGVYYAATHVERVVCGESPVMVVGAGNSAGQAVVFLAETAGHVFHVVRGGNLRSTMSSYLATRVETLAQEGRVSVLLNTEVCALHGESLLLQLVTLRNRSTDASQEVDVRAVFVMIGVMPCTEWLREGSNIALDAKGFVLTGREAPWSLDRPPFFLETSCPGVFAAGDARAGSVKRVASAVGEGSMAIAFAHQYLAL